MKQIAAILLLVALAVPAAAMAQPAGAAGREAIWTLTTVAGVDPVRLEGYQPSVELNLVLPQGWAAASDGELSLAYRISDLVFAQAALTVRLNDRTVASSLFPDHAGVLTIALPAALFLPQKNVLRLEAVLPLDGDADCIVPVHPARWVEFGSGSLVRLGVRSEDTALALAEFPAQFEALGDEGTVAFVLPDQPDDDELSAMAAVAFALQRASVTNPSWAVVSAGDYQPGGPAVLIGAAGRIANLDRMAPDGPARSSWLRLARPDWSGGQAVLGIGGEDGPAVLRAAGALLDPVALLEMGSDVARIENQPKPAQPAPPEETTLSDLGYRARMVRGTGERSLIYSFDLPFEWSPADAKLVAHLASGALLDPNVATVTVLLNGSTALDLRLDAPEAVPHRVEMTLPRGLLRPGRNYLRFAFDLGTPVSSCVVNMEDKPWALVRPETTLNVPHSRSGGRTDLADFPEMFGSPVDLAELIVVLPVQSTEADLAEALRVVRVLSLRGSASPSAPRLLRAESLTAELRRSHLVVLGEALRQPLVNDLHNYLPMGFDRETGSLRQAHGIRVPTGTPDVGVLQLLRSPWEKNRLVLVVSGTSAKGYAEAVALLSAPAPQPGPAGDLAVVSRSAGAPGPQVVSQSVADVGAVPVVGPADRILGRFLDANGPGPALVLVMLTLLLLAVGVGLVSLRRGRSAGAQGGPEHGAR